MFRNLKKSLFTTILNVIGLSVAFAAFIIILIQVNYDLGYNKCFKGSDRLFRVEGAFNLADMTHFQTTLSRPILRRFGNCSPNIESFGDFSSNGQLEFKISDLENAPYINMNTCYMTKGSLQAFGIEIVSGDTANFVTDHDIMLSESTAKTMFGNENPIGKTIDQGEDFKNNIVAIYKDLPENCCVKNGAIGCFGDYNSDNRSEWSYTLILKLIDAAKYKDVADLMVAEMADMYKDDEEVSNAFKKAAEDAQIIRLTPIHDAHFSKDINYDWMEKASLSTTYSLLTIAILIIIIAIINFINFSMASIPLTIKGINTRKVLGESSASLRLRQIAQAVAISVISFLVALIWVYILSGTSFGGFISGSIALGANIPTLLLTAAVALFTGVAAGIYPAIYSTKFSPALVIKGSFSLSPKGRHLRTGLVALQYVISLVLIIVALFINVQSSFMKKFDMGYSTSNILTFRVSNKLGNTRDALESKLKENPIIADVTFAQDMIISNGKMGWGRQYKGKQIRFDCFPVAPNFIEFFGMEVVEGRGFAPEDDQKINGTMIMNEAMQKTYPDIIVGEKVAGHQDEPSDLVGVVKNFNFQPLQYKINPIALYVFGSEPWWPIRFTYVKPAPQADIKECIEYISKTIREMDPNIREEDVNVRFMDDRVGQLYQKEDNLGKLILIFCGLSVLISIIGILGLIYFETQFKKKEIGVRRVYGSSVGQILKMLNYTYIKIASICFAISIPISMVIIKIWLKSFTYQADIPVWLFIAAYAIIIFITVLVITLQSIRAASANPVDSIKNE